MMDRPNILSSIFWLLIAAFAIISSISLGIGEFHNPRAGFFPFWAGILLAFFAVILLVRNSFKKEKIILLATLWKDLNWGKIVIAVAALITYCLVLAKLGYIIATFGLMIILFYLGKMKSWGVILGSLLAVLLSYGLFHYGLITPLPKGILPF
jgi:putative tricarboxylic transport membrane protein